MNTCDEWLDRMPGLAGGVDEMPPEFSAHLEKCADCRANWQVVQAGSRVGASAATAIDPARLSQVVLARLAAARRTDRTRRHWTWGTVLAAAAALTLVVYTGRAGTPISRDSTAQHTADPQTASTASFVVPVSGLDDLDATELQSVYDQLDGALEGSGSVAAPHLEELSPDEMEQVLNSLEG